MPLINSENRKKAFLKNGIPVINPEYSFHYVAMGKNIPNRNLKTFKNNRFKNPVFINNVYICIRLIGT